MTRQLGISLASGGPAMANMWQPIGHDRAVSAVSVPLPSVGPHYLENQRGTDLV